MMPSKHIEFGLIALRNLRRFPGRALAIFVPLFTVMAFAAAMTFIKDGISRDALYSLQALADITVQQMTGGRISNVGPELAQEILKNENVLKVVPRVWGYVPVWTSRGSVAYTLLGIDAGRLLSGRDLSLEIESGRFLNPGEKGSAVVGIAYAQQNKVKPGDTISIDDGRGNESLFHIAGVFNSAAKIYTADLIITDIESARTVLGYGPGQSSDLSVYVKDPRYAQQVSTFIVTTYKNVRAVSKEDLAGIIKQEYSGKAGVFQLMWLILLLTVLMLAWSQAGSIGLEMKKEIGILKALGWRTLDIMELKMMEIAIIGLAGILGGMVFGIFYLYMGAPFIRQYFLGWAVIYPLFSLPVYIEWSSLFLLFVIGFFPLCVATIFPVWLMGTIQPDSAIRNG